MNEILRRAILSAHLDEVDVAARLEVDPKTVRRWLEGRLPYTRYRWALADLLNLNETDLWPELRPSPSRPDELLAVYPHRSSIPRETWRNLFASAERDINVLAYSSLFLAEDADIIRIFAEKARGGARIRIAMADPEAPHVTECSAQEEIGGSMVVKIRKAIALYRPLLEVEHVEIRLHRTVLYNSIYRADNELLCHQYAHGIAAARSPVLHLQHQNDDDMARAYLVSFDRIWNTVHI